MQTQHTTDQFRAGLTTFIVDEVATADETVDGSTDLLLSGLVDSLGVVMVSDWIQEQLVDRDRSRRHRARELPDRRRTWSPTSSRAAPSRLRDHPAGRRLRPRRTALRTHAAAGRGVVESAPVPERPVANMATAHRIGGPIDPDRFVEAFDDVVRACDVSADGGRRRCGCDRTRSRRRCSRHRRCAQRSSISTRPRSTGGARARIARPIDATACCYDSVLLRHADDDWTWWLDLHHLVTDATSQTLVHRLTSLAYEGAEVSAASYADFAADQAADADDLPTPGDGRRTRTPTPTVRRRGGATTTVERAGTP